MVEASGIASLGDGHPQPIGGAVELASRMMNDPSLVIRFGAAAVRPAGVRMVPR